jgi:hypothetical protein
MKSVLGTKLGLILLGALAAARPCAGSAELRERFAVLAKEVLKTTKRQPVSVGVFSPTGLGDTNSGVGLEEVLRFELEREEKGIVRPDAKYEVKGDYAYARSRDERFKGLRVVKVIARVIEKEFSEAVLEAPLEVVLDGTRTIQEVLQVSAALDPDGKKEARNQDLDRAQQSPAVHVHEPGGTLVSSTPESSYAVEVLVKPLAGHEQAEAKPRAARVAGGRAFVEVQRGELYEVRLHNRSGDLLAASVTVDGLDVFHFSKDRAEDGRPRFTHFIVEPKGWASEGGGVSDGTATVVGWHRSLEGKANYLSFLVTAYGQGAASKEGIAARGATGVINVQFSRCKPLPEGAKPRGDNETGFGPPRTVIQKAVSVEVEPPHDFVSVRYNR